MRASSAASSGIGVGVVQLAQQLLLGELVAGGPVAADADAEEAGAAALALGFQTASRMQARTPSRSRSQRLPPSVAGSEYWALMFSQPPPLRIKADVDRVLAVLVPVEDGAAGAEVVAGVAAGDAIDGVLPQVALGGGLGDGVQQTSSSSS